jgi:hypothetical protein
MGVVCGCPSSFENWIQGGSVVIPTRSFVRSHRSLVISATSKKSKKLKCYLISLECTAKLVQGGGRPPLIHFQDAIKCIHWLTREEFMLKPNDIQYFLTPEQHQRFQPQWNPWRCIVFQYFDFDTNSNVTLSSEIPGADANNPEHVHLFRQLEATISNGGRSKYTVQSSENGQFRLTRTPQ